MLGTCEQLAAGLGASSVKRKREGEGVEEKGGGGSVDGVGNAPLRLWLGERFLGKRSLLLVLRGHYLMHFFFLLQRYTKGSEKKARSRSKSL